MLNPDPQADRAALIMNVTPFDVNWEDPPYKGVRTARYTYTLSPDGPLMLSDHQTDPYQLKNLVGDPEYRDIEASLHQKLMDRLKNIGEEELHPREYYLDKWGYEIERKAINYWSFNEGQGKVQGPGLKADGIDRK